MVRGELQSDFVAVNVKTTCGNPIRTSSPNISSSSSKTTMTITRSNFWKSLIVYPRSSVAVISQPGPRRHEAFEGAVAFPAPTSEKGRGLSSWNLTVRESAKVAL